MLIASKPREQLRCRPIAGSQVNISAFDDIRHLIYGRYLMLQSIADLPLAPATRRRKGQAMTTSFPSLSQRLTRATAISRDDMRAFMTTINFRQKLLAESATGHAV